MCHTAISPGNSSWTLVRHNPVGYPWHPATDQLLGTQEFTSWKLVPMTEHGCTDGITRTAIAVVGEVRGAVNGRCWAWANYYVIAVQFRCSADQSLVGLTAQTTSKSAAISHLDYGMCCGCWNNISEVHIVEQGEVMVFILDECSD